MAEEKPKLAVNNDEVKCPEHPHIAPEMGFGLAGGGYGPYLYCPECGRILFKTQERE